MLKHMPPQKYDGKKGPVISLNDLPDVSDHRIVGIDLTGSETKASGWALLENGTAQTKTVLSNPELIKETIKLQPAVISIDSPLSLPVGRISVFDDDPGRKEYGITRACERIMAKRGIKSYPPLIQSMQRLTQRGIYLANEFRKQGYTVIESYPGAAQDILGIPRKRKSLECLVKGLQSFGIKGTYDRKGITHDEIDAITAALVGYFYLAGKYEQLGNEEEGYLIIPDIEVKPLLTNE
jgi:predicted nuclease with RNAse H fold